VVDIGHMLSALGFTMIEVPLNSPDPLESISLLAKVFETRSWWSRHRNDR
jgi:2-dehydro-3-deoxyphosphogalactonate aldolase